MFSAPRGTEGLDAHTMSNEWEPAAATRESWAAAAAARLGVVRGMHFTYYGDVKHFRAPSFAAGADAPRVRGYAAAQGGCEKTSRSGWVL